MWAAGVVGVGEASEGGGVGFAMEEEQIAAESVADLTSEEGRESMAVFC